MVIVAQFAKAKSKMHMSHTHTTQLGELHTMPLTLLLTLSTDPHPLAVTRFLRDQSLFGLG